MRRRKRYIRLPKRQRRLVGVVVAGYAIILVNSLLLLLFDRSTALIYMSNVLLHICMGLLLVPPVIVFLVMHLMKMPFRLNWRATGAGAFTAASLMALMASGIALVALGSSYGDRWILWLHIATAITSILGFVLHVSLKKGLRYHFLDWGESWKKGTVAAVRHPVGITMAAGLALTVLVAVVPWLSSRHDVYVAEEEGIIREESQALLAHDGFFEEMDLARSETCGQEGCHPDIYEQWSESMHRFSSFNNPYYKKTVEYMVSRSGTEPARWCASCHDPVLLFSGRFEEAPIDVDHWTAHEGLTCLSCHAIEGLRDVKGNGRYVIARPDEYPFARAEKGTGRWVHNVLIRAKPEPHRRAMLKPVHTMPELCGTCHKVGVPPEVNNYRWKRGQNEYDAWHASGVSGNTVRSFYLPPEPKPCSSCHMPLVASQDQGNDDGFVRSHRFAAANTAIAHLNRHDNQFEAAQNFLEGGVASVDVFRVVVNGRAYDAQDPMPVLREGDHVEVDVVIRNIGVGHMLPGGTNDSNELWLELTAKEEGGRSILASGAVADDGSVDSTAHFLGAVLVDRASQAIDKRNVQDWITNVYVNVIGPGAARVVHYRFTVPGGLRIARLDAALKHRKFKWYYNQWTFSGYPISDDSLVSAVIDRREWRVDPSVAPDLPITTLAADLRQADNREDSARPIWERWNDYGIGLLLEGDTRSALTAFERVAEIDRANPEGPINMARVLLEEGQLERAMAALTEAEDRRPGYLKTAYFRGEVYKASAQYDDALAEWMRVYEAYPQDRVLLQNVGRVHYLAGRYEDAVVWFDRVLAIDPENVGGLYNKMLSLGALGRDEAFAQVRALYAYHKDDEEAQAVASPYKRAHPMDNREAQLLHEHELHVVRESPDVLSPGSAGSGGDSSPP